MAQKTVVKPTTATAARVATTACAYNHDGRMMAAGLMDGTIQVSRYEEGPSGQHPVSLKLILHRVKSCFVLHMNSSRHCFLKHKSKRS